MGKKESFTKLLLTIMIVPTFITFYLPMLRTWFFSDDIHWIWASATNEFKEIFFVPERYRTLATNFTPMLGASFKIDWILFKMNSTGYSIHSLISLTGVAIVFYIFLRLYVNERIASVGVLLLLLNPITLSITSWFSTRHYIEGLFWVLLSLYIFIRKDREGEISLTPGIFYLIASLYKETYVILPAVAFLLSKEPILKRFKRTSPLWICLIIYAIWRFWIMGGIGGYPSNQPFTIKVIIPVLYKIIRFLSFHWFGDYHVLFIPFLFVISILSVRNVKMLFIFLILIIPIIPVSNILDESHYMGRYLFHFSVFLICTICLFMEHQTKHGKSLYNKIAVLSLCILIITIYAKQDMRFLTILKQERLRAKETANEFINSEKQFIPSEQPYWFYEGLKKIYKRFYGRDILTQFIPDEKFIKYTAPERLKEMKSAGINIPYNEIISLQQRRKEWPIIVRITLEGYKLSWNLGPDKEKSYTLLYSHASGMYYDSVNLPSSGKFMLSKDNKDIPSEPVYIRISYLAADGNEVTTPEFVLNIPGNQKIEYFRLR